MSGKQTKAINKKFDNNIEQVLDRIHKSADMKDSDTHADVSDLVLKSEEVVSKVNDNDQTISKEISDSWAKPESNDDIEQLKSLVAVKKEYNDHKVAIWDTVIKAGVSILSIGVLLGFEMNHSITSRSLSFMPKPKL